MDGIQGNELFREEQWEEAHRLEQFRLNQAIRSLEYTRDVDAWGAPGPSRRREDPPSAQDTSRRSTAAHRTSLPFSFPYTPLYCLYTGQHTSERLCQSRRGTLVLLILLRNM